ncbi:MAG: hypothetical protein QOE61_4422 [Micromonosporaceae bacterium]|nr:hypothetical protein [Micromonosporaceae bacterium]
MPALTCSSWLYPWKPAKDWGVSAASLSEAFSPPAWVDSAAEEVEVAAEIGGDHLSLPGFLLTTRRTT